MAKRCQEKDCPLWKGGIEVKYEGPKDAKVVVCGESPGRMETLEGRPFVGDAGMKLRHWCLEAELPYRKLFVMNAARCMINKKELTTKQVTMILKCCRNNVERVLKALRPKAIIVLGDFALRQIMKKSGITKSRGNWYYSNEFDCWVLPTFHPAFILRGNDGMEPWCIKDIRLVREFVASNYQHSEVEDDIDYQEVQSLAGLIPADGAVRAYIDSETQTNNFMSSDWVLLSYSISFTKGVSYHVQLHEECALQDADFTVKAMRRPDPAKKKKELVDVGVKRSNNFRRKMLELKAVLESNRLKKYIMTNYELHAFREGFIRAGMTPPRIGPVVMELQSAANVLNEVLYNMSSLSDLQQAFTDYKDDYKRKFNMEYDKTDMLAVPRKDMVHYACADADVTGRVGSELRKQFAKQSNERLLNYYIKFTIPTIQKTITALETYGAYIDMPAFPGVRDKIESDAKEAANRALRIVPKTVKKKHNGDWRLTRREFLQDILFSKKGFNLKPIKKAPSGEGYSTDKETRMLLLEQEGISAAAGDFINEYNEWAELSYTLSHSLKGFEKWVQNDGRIHSQFNLVRARTGRVSSASPNMMNNPKRSKLAPSIRRLIAAAPGYVLLAADEEQSELRWMAELSRDPAMREVFARGEDIHTATAKLLTQRPWNELTEEERKTARRNAKPVNFGLLYKMTVEGFQRYAKKEYGITLSLQEADAYVKAFFNKYRRISNYHENTINFCRKHLFVESPLGRRRRFPEINSPDKWVRLKAERDAVNHPIQSPSSDVVLMACNEIIDLDIDPQKFRPIMFIHDELVFELKEDEDIRCYAKLLKDAMENPQLERDFNYKMEVPLASSVKVGKNLADMEEIKF